MNDVNIFLIFRLYNRNRCPSTRRATTTRRRKRKRRNREERKKRREVRTVPPYHQVPVPVRTWYEVLRTTRTTRTLICRPEKWQLFCTCTAVPVPYYIYSKKRRKKGEKKKRRKKRRRRGKKEETNLNSIISREEEEEKSAAWVCGIDYIIYTDGKKYRRVFVLCLLHIRVDQF